jgi:hypothetical protein
MTLVKEASQILFSMIVIGYRDYYNEVLQSGRENELNSEYNKEKQEMIAKGHSV